MTDTGAPVDKIKRNAEIAAKSAHTYLTIAVSVGASILLALGPDWVTAFIQQHPALSSAAPFVSLLFVLLTQVAPQNITLASDKQKAVDAARAWVLDLAAKAMPGQPIAVPPAVAKAVGLPAVLHPPTPASPAVPVVDLFDDTAPLPIQPAPPPMPATAVMGDQRMPMVPVAPPPAFDLANQLRAMSPWKTDAEIAAEIAAWSRPPTP